MSEEIAELNDKIDQFFLPGVKLFQFETIYELESRFNLGFGLTIDEFYSKSQSIVSVVVSHSGILKFAKPNRIWIESKSKIFIPSEGDRIIGKVVKQSGDYYQIDFGGSSIAHLSYLNFQEATKNNRPKVKIGDIVYCEVRVAGEGIETEVTCVNELGKSVGMGVIDHGDDSIIRVGLAEAKRLFDAKLFPLLKKLGLTVLPHEVIIGCNGWIWLSARSSRELVTLRNCISIASSLSPTQIADFVKYVRMGMFCTDN